MHYLSAANDRQFTLNMKECPELLTAHDYDEICREMLAFQEANNRLTYSDEETGETAPVTVEDKSFSRVEDVEPAAVQPVEPAPALEPQIDVSVQEFVPPAVALTPAAKPSLLDSVKGFFRS
jgi:hypothetical protein